jgi:hypothetical protein
MAEGANGAFNRPIVRVTSEGIPSMIQLVLIP